MNKETHIKLPIGYSLIFLILYLLINGLGIIILGASVYFNNPFSLFATAWINASEIYTYGSTTEGLVLNLLVPFLAIFWVELFFHYSEFSFNNLPNVKEILTMGVFASYVLSPFPVLFGMQPGNGTSILGFTVFLYFGIMFLRAFRFHDKKWVINKDKKMNSREKKLAESAMVLFIFYLAFAFLLYLYFPFILGARDSIVLHLSGGAIFGLLVYGFYKISKNISEKNSKL